jgi:hypothetical protein
MKQKSISWTRRGVKKGSKVVLQFLWKWHTAATKQVCPLPHLDGSRLTDEDMEI